MDPVVVWLVVTAVLFGVAAVVPIANGNGGIRGVTIGLVPLGLMCLAIAQITARS